MNHIITPPLKNSTWRIFPFFLFLLLSGNYSSGAEDDHGKHAEEGRIKLTREELEEFGIRIEKATSGVIEENVTLPGEIVIDPGRLMHIVPPVSGVARDVYKQLGDKAHADELLATLSSRELAEIRAELRAAQGRYKLAQATYERESKLKKEGITSEQEFLATRQARDAALIEYNLARQKLEAIGISSNDQNRCLENCDPTIFEIRSPGEGIIVEKHIVRGEMLDSKDRPFVIANLDQVWINVTVYQEYLKDVQVGQKVRIVSSSGDTVAESIIDYISPIVAEATRSATARVIVDNMDGTLRSGLFVNAIITISDSPARIMVPQSALQTIDNRIVLFVVTGNGFEPRAVRTGRSNAQYIEIIEGLDKGDEYVAEHGFILKAEMQKSAFGDDHGH